MVEQLRRHRDYERRVTGPDPPRPGSGPCPVRIALFGNPNGGTWEVDVTVLDDTETPVTEAVTIPYNATANAHATTGIKTALATHSELVEDDVTASTLGGSMPSHEMTLRFSKSVTFGNPDTTNLTGGLAPYVFIH